jgi:hypothetical protein
MNADANIVALRADTTTKPAAGGQRRGGLALGPAADARPAAGERVLQLSMRRLSRLVANSMLYEFEDVVGEVTAADRVDVVDPARLTRSRRAYKLLRHASGSARLARALTPTPRTARLEDDYALFFPCFNDAYELYALATIPEWRQRCRYAACYISEMWPGQLPGYLLELLADFDHIFLSMHGPVAEVARITGRPCSVLPLAADVCRFSPYPQPSARVIDVCNLGRRSAVTHRRLLELACARQLTYYYDTVAASGLDRCQRTFQVQDPAEHRLLLAQLLRVSRYYVANRARINEPTLTGGWQEISGRFYEGAAAGVVMLGEPPDNPVFRELFDWPEAVIPLPFDAPDIDRRLAELDADPGRLVRIGRRNARQAALRHDWLHRLGQVYAIFKLPPTEGMRAREARLEALARLAED